MTTTDSQTDSNQELLAAYGAIESIVAAHRGVRACDLRYDTCVEAVKQAFQRDSVTNAPDGVTAARETVDLCAQYEAAIKEIESLKRERDSLRLQLTNLQRSLAETFPKR